MLGPGKRMNNSLVNHGATRGNPGAKHVSFPAGPFTDAVPSRLRGIDPADLRPDDAGVTRVADLRVRVADIEDRIKVLRNELESGDGEVRAAVAALRGLEARHGVRVAELAVEQAKAASPSAEFPPSVTP